MADSIPYHIPALLPEVLEALNIRHDGIYVDATYGGGGHSRAIVSDIDDGKLFGIDQDSDAIAGAICDKRFTAIHGNFRHLSNFMRYYGTFGKVDGILADLGVSFHHFDDAERGFSFRADAPLDMRMNRSSDLTAARLLEECSEERLEEIFKIYGEFRQAKKLAKTIVRTRATKPIKTTSEFVDLINPMINPAQRKKELAQVFQALRIVVNGEMDALESLLEQAVKVLAPGGRLVIITYHSLEDRLVKNFMRSGRLDGEIQKDLFGNNLSPLRLINSKPIVPTEEEIERNPRSRSAKLRIAEKSATKK